MFFNLITNTQNIKVSGSHLISIQNNQFKFAKELVKGDTIVTFDTTNQTKKTETIQSIHIVKVDKYSAPLTMSGTLLVDDVLVSCYAEVNNHFMAHNALAPIRYWHHIQKAFNNILPEVIHSKLTIEKQSNGTHWFPSLLYSIYSLKNF